MPTITALEKKLFLLSIPLALLALYLVKFHTAFVLLTLPFCLGMTFGIASIICRVCFGRNWIPVSKLDDWRQFTWVDKILTWMAILAGILLLFYFGEIADCLRHEDVWKSGFLQLNPKLCEQFQALMP